ncbi:MAG: PilN domain-containing protein [Thermodesulfobacteriota bacterium]
MAKKYIGIDIGSRAIRVVTGAPAKTGMVFTGGREYPAADPGERRRVLAGLRDEVTFGDRVVACLPAVGSYYRILPFPFADSGKIEAAVDLQMAAALPASEALLADFLPARPDDGGYAVPVVAVRRTSVEETAALFNEAGCPLHLLDAAPFAYGAGLAGILSAGTLAVVTDTEITVSRIDGGQVVAYRIIPRLSDDAPGGLAAQLAQAYWPLAGSTGARLLLLGETPGGDLRRQLADHGIPAEYPSLSLDGRDISPALLPAAALTLRAALPIQPRRLNFLKGELAPANEWAGFRRQLIGVGALLALAATLAAASAWLHYDRRQQRAEDLRRQTLAVFRQTFPEVTAIVDVPSQMQTKLAELRARARLFRPAANRSALEALRELSARVPPDLSLDTGEFSWNGTEVQLDGVTSSFEASNRLATLLGDSPLFRQPRITDARMSQDGSRVEFRLTLQLEEERP